MKIAVLGAGAMGSWFGGQLALRGNDVQLLTTNAEHRNAINKNGLKLRSAGTEASVVVPAVPPEDLKSPVDLILLFTKAFQSSNAISSIADGFDDNTHVLSLQNGLGNAETIAGFIPLDRVWIGNSMMPVDKVEPGLVACEGRGSSYFGSAHPEAAINNQEMADRISQSFAGTGIELAHVDNIQQRIWEKVAFNAGMNALSALSRGTPGAIRDCADAKNLARDVAIEVASVAASQQVVVDIDTVFDMITLSCEKHSDHIPSMLQDILDGKRTEVDALNGFVVDKASEAGVAAPLNSVLATLVRLAEQAGTRSVDRH